MSTRRRVLDFMAVMLNGFYPDWFVYQGKQNVAVKRTPNMVIDLMGERNVGDQVVWDNDEKKYVIKGLREATFSILAIGEDAVEALANLRQIIERPSVVDEFYLANVAVIDVGEVQDLTEVIDGSRYLERSNVDLTISYDRMIVDDVGWMNKLSINSSYINGDAIGDGEIKVK